MPKRTDIHSILIIGAGPIIIGQACEFDYSGAQACKALREEGYRVILVNSNPATIMTDPEMADAIYIEPVNAKSVARIIEKERPDALLPTMGGQTALNTALDLVREGVLEKYGVEMIAASRAAIDMAEDRELFRNAMREIGLETAQSQIARSLDEALAIAAELGYPVVDPSLLHHGRQRRRHRLQPRGARDHRRARPGCLPTGEVLLEESVIGWKEFEMEVVRDHKDNCIIVCSIENFDPMGVHTGDSITVAPALTLTDKEYQRMRDASIAVLRKIGVDTGGSNVQFAVNPKDGRLLVIEMNPRVSRSSALASKATGFPIAKIAAKLAVGYTLDELKNDITGGATPASFEPSIDYVVMKIPRFTFEKFPAANDRLTTQMKSVGEVMAIGRTFQESLQKALRGLETGLDGLAPQLSLPLSEEDADRLAHELRAPGAEPAAVRRGCLPRRLDARARSTSSRTSTRGSSRRSRTWSREEDQVRAEGLGALDAERLRALKRKGFSDSRLAGLVDMPEKADPRQAPRAESGAGLQARRHLRGRVRHFHRLPLLDLRGGVRGESDQPAQDHDPRRRPEPHRPGDRVRLLLRARGPAAARGRVRDHHGQLQPRDRLHRLRHLRPAVLRAPDARGRARDPRGREARRGDRAVRRPDAAEAVARARGGRRADHRHLARFDRHRRGPRALPGAGEEARAQAAGQRHRAQRGAGRCSWRARSASRWWCAPPTCSAAAPWKWCSPRRTCAST